MGKYRVEVGAFVTRMTTRHITVNAKSEEEAKEKAIDRYYKLEQLIPSSVDAGSPQVDFIEKLSD